MTTNIYTVGGTVQASGGRYIARAADERLFALCRDAVFAYVLAPRQVGKSSLMVRTAERLNQAGIRSVQIDLTQLGVQLSAEEWYLGLITAIEDQLLLATDTVAWWQARAHLGVTQRLTLFFEEVLLTEISAPIVVFVDEIDTTLSLDFTDDFYAAIRYLYNARSRVPEFARLSFVLVGVATPGDLIRDPQRTPFNIGQRVDLTDWSLQEALPLAEGLGLPNSEARRVLGRMLQWTGGHPYLTQRLCQAVTANRSRGWANEEIDRVVRATFFGMRSEQDNNLQFVRDMLTKRTRNPSVVLATYHEIRRGQRRVPDEEQSLVKSHLLLSGVVSRSSGVLRVRNAIYWYVFSERWVRDHLPNNYWTKRLRRTARLALIMMVTAVFLGLLAFFTNVQRVALQEALATSEIAERNAESSKATALAGQQKAKLAEDAAVVSQQTAVAAQATSEARRQEAISVKTNSLMLSARLQPDPESALVAALQAADFMQQNNGTDPSGQIESVLYKTIQSLGLRSV
ncbi:MAG TPA: AAA-like domain-containing protein, partial [Roseiflexaceae bacterium]|nr:AAA-like domain-containing protein [Roseiflexaceae bacterium]